MATGRKTGGRRKGTPNRVTAEIKAAFQLHGDELVDALLALTKDKDPLVRLGATRRRWIVAGAGPRRQWISA